ncbi:uncharacterized protein LOC144828491 isoform X1 [Lissotriton helveticus]
MTSECSNPVSISRTYTLPSSAVSDIRIRTLEDAVACHGYSFQLIPQLELSSPGFQGDLVCEGLLPYLSLLHIYSASTAPGDHQREAPTMNIYETLLDLHTTAMTVHNARPALHVSATTIHDALHASCCLLSVQGETPQR